MPCSATDSSEPNTPASVHSTTSSNTESVRPTPATRPEPITAATSPQARGP
jgi:hypothetical protein